jgi:hypothetical protein
MDAWSFFQTPRASSNSEAALNPDAALHLERWGVQVSPGTAQRTRGLGLDVWILSQSFKDLKISWRAAFERNQHFTLHLGVAKCHA